MIIHEHDTKKKVYKINEIFNGDIFRLKDNDIEIFMRLKYLNLRFGYNCFNLKTNAMVDIDPNTEIYLAKDPTLNFSYETIGKEE